MEAFGQPISALLSAMAGFVRVPATKLLHVHASVGLRKGCVEAVMAFERDPHNGSAFYLFEQPHATANEGWPDRCEHARNQHGHRQEAMAEQGESIAALGEAPTLPDPKARFAAQLLQLSAAAPAQADGTVIVLAPSTLEAADAWRAALEPLVTDPRLAAVRYVVVETPPAPTAALAKALGERAKHVRVAANKDAEDREVEAMLEGIEPGAPPPGAAPKAAPPQHPAARAPASATPDSELRGLISKKLVASALATKRGEAAGAVQSTREARDLASQAGLHRDAINLELVLGGQLLAGGSAKQSELAFTRAVDTAKEHDRKSQVATGLFAIGATKMGRRDKQGALVSYAEGTVAAEQSNQPVLAIEGGRLTGQLASDLGMQAQAIAFWTKSVKLGEAAGSQAPLTSAGESARSLAAMCRKRGLGDQAAKFEAQADALENVVVPDAPEAMAGGPADAGDSPADEAPAPKALREADAPRLAVGVAQAPAGAPPPAPAFFGAPPGEDEEGTDMLSMDDISRMRSGVEAASEDNPQWFVDGEAAEGGGELDEAQLEVLRNATIDVLDEESTSMLSREELAVLNGELPFVVPALESPADGGGDGRDAPVPVPEPEPEPEPDLGFDLSALDALRDADIDDEEDGGSTMHRRDAFDDE